MPDLVIPSIGLATPPASTGLTSATTCADLINETKTLLYSAQREERNKLATTMNNSVTDVVLTYADPNGGSGGAKSGAKLSIGLEDMHVWPGGTHPTVPVERGQFGSVAAPHNSGEIILINARFSDFVIFRALNEALLDISSPGRGLFRIRQLPDPVWVASQQGYDMNGVDDLIDIYEIEWKSPVTTTKRWPEIRNWRLRRDMPTADFPSSMALSLTPQGTPGQPIHIRYKAPFGQLSAVTDIVTDTTGISPYALDILPLWAAVRLAGPREIARNFYERQGDTRRQSEVPAGAAAAAIRNPQTDLEMRIRREAQRLAAQYPDRRVRY